MENLISAGGTVGGGAGASSGGSTRVDAVAPPVPAGGAVANGAATEQGPASGSATQAEGADLGWVWREVRKRVFLKLPFSVGVADAMEAAHPIALEHNAFVVGMSPKAFPLSSHILSDHAKKTIENILRAAAGRRIVFEVIEGHANED